MDWTMLGYIALFAVGLGLIIKGGDFFVDAASWIAESFGIPKFIVGATIVSLATTLPELLVSITAAFEGQTEMAIGNAIGSVTANSGLIMGISVLFAPMVICRKTFMPKGFLLLGSVLLLYLLSLGGYLNVLPAMLMFVLLALFFVENVISAKNEIKCAQEQPKSVEKDKKTVTVNTVKFILGILGIVGGSRLLVTYGTLLAEKWGVPEAVISVTMIAIGTSLPELTTTIVALTKKQSSLSVGNIIGANIIDLTLILPICSIISGKSLPIQRQTMWLDMPFCLGIIAIAIIPTVIFKKFHKLQGLAMLAAYATYLTLMFVNYL